MFLGADVSLLDDRVTADDAAESSESLAVMVPVAAEIECRLPLQADKKTTVDLSGLEAGGGYYPAFMVQGSQPGMFMPDPGPLLIHSGVGANLHHVNRTGIVAAVLAGRYDPEDAAIAKSPVAGECGKIVAGHRRCVRSQQYAEIAQLGCDF